MSRFPPAPKARSRAVAWFPVTRTGKVALTLAYLTVLSPAWVFIVLGQALFQAGASDDVVLILLVAAFAVLLSAALTYFLWWVITAPGAVAG